MKLWIDDWRPAPDGYYWCTSVNEAKKVIAYYGSWVDWDNNIVDMIELIDVGYDAGKYAKYGGNYIKLLEWLEETGRNYPICLHSQNSIGVKSMRRIIQRNGWKEVY